MDLFIHVGYPKCFSTTLQRNFFSKHPQIFYGGIGINSNIDFYNKELNLLFESGLIYFNRYLFNKNIDRFQKAVEDFKNELVKKGAKVGGFSSEHLIFNFSAQGVAQHEKLERLFRLFGANVKIILILRQPKDFIVSIYKEFVRMGCPYDFQQFAEWLYKYQDRNFLYDLRYDEVMETLLRFIPKQNLFVAWFENYKDREAANLNKLFDEIAAFLNISPLSFEDVPHFNPSLSDAEILAQIPLNKKYRYDFGDIHLEGVENHRRRVYFNDFLELGYSEEQLFENVVKKRNALAEAKAAALKDVKISYESEYLDRVLSLLGQG